MALEVKELLCFRTGAWLFRTFVWATSMIALCFFPARCLGLGRNHLPKAASDPPSLVPGPRGHEWFQRMHCLPTLQLLFLSRKRILHLSIKVCLNYTHHSILYKNFEKLFTKLYCKRECPLLQLTPFGWGWKYWGGQWNSWLSRPWGTKAPFL